MVHKIVVQPDGKILVGGRFENYAGTARSKIIRLNSDGSIDGTFFAGSGFPTGSFAVFDLALQSDGKILVGGMFPSYGGVSRNRILRLNSDGTLDTSFVVGTGFDTIVNAIKVQTDGKILVGGLFTSYNGTSKNYIIRLNSDGSIDGTFSIGSGFNNQVQTIALQADGKILIGGSFTSYNGTSAKAIVRLNSDGTLDTSFTTNIRFSSASGSVSISYLTTKTSGYVDTIYASGGFTTFNETLESSFIQIDLTNSIVNSLTKNGSFRAMYRSYEATWEVGGFQSMGDDVGVEIDINSSGQVSYTSTNLAGTLIESFIRYKYKKM